MFIVAAFVVFFAAFVAAAIYAVRRTAAGSKADAGSGITDVALTMHRGPAPTALATLLQPLATVDPHFSSSAFLAYAGDAFARVAETPEFAADATAGLPVSASMSRRLAQGAGGGAGSDVASGIRLAEKSIRAVRVDAAEQAIDVQLAGDWIVGGNDAARVSFAKLVTFVRPGGATTRAGEDQVSDQPLGQVCPHCGAAQDKRGDLCPFCGAQLDVSGSPWLIDAIADSPLTRDAGEKPEISTTIGVMLASRAPGAHSPANVAIGSDLQPALDRLAQADPQFSKERFMRWATSAYLRDRARRRPMNASLKKSYMLAIVTDDTSEEIAVIFDSIAAGGARVVEAAVFSRPAGSHTPPPPNAAPNALCAECGATLDAGDTKCRYCGAAIPDDQGAWALEKVGATAESILRSP